MYVISSEEDLVGIKSRIDEIFYYLSDNSCGDPDCCGGPYYNREDAETAIAELSSVYGIVVRINL